MLNAVISVPESKEMNYVQMYPEYEEFVTNYLKIAQDILFIWCIAIIHCVFRTGFTPTGGPSHLISDPTSLAQWPPAGIKDSRGLERRTRCGQCGLSTSCTLSRSIQSTTTWGSTRATTTRASVSTVGRSASMSTPRVARISVGC
jgi:hypothetical protein